MKVFCFVVAFVALLEIQTINAKPKGKKPKCGNNGRRRGHRVSRDEYKTFRKCRRDRSVEHPSIADCRPGGKLYDLNLRFCEIALNHPQLWWRSPLQYARYFRGRRDIATNFTMKSRQSRALPGNPCTGSVAVPVYFFYGLKVATSEVVEIIQDPVNGHYQQFFTYPCAQAGYGAFECAPQSVEYLIQIFTPIGNMEFAQVSVATTCGIHVPIG